MNDTTKSEDNTADDGDWLGYGVYADTLWDRALKALADDKVGDDPLVIGLFGEWGAGKSYLLDLIYKKAVQKNKQDCKDKSRVASDKPMTLTIPVLFQPWKYEHEAHLGVPLLMHIQAELGKTLQAAHSPLEELFADSAKVTFWGKKTIKDKREQVKNFSKVLENEFFQVGMGVAAGAIFTPAAGVAATAGIKWLAARREELLESTESIEKWDTTEKKAQSNVPLVSTDGSYYYKTHEMLRKLTRIKKPKAGEKSDIKGLDDIRHDVQLNFVIFVDDLDRCLPEKAVQVLELIKTLLNVESFAFVLALDDEVIERGIGHRYKDYALIGKKPEMPITGFEYLEKIVHLPFRLPTLTKAQAENFVREYEKKIQSDENLQWFKSLAVIDKPIDEAHMGREIASKRSDLLDLALVGFDAYVPRKLIRMVELVQQIDKIAREGLKNPISFEPHLSRDARIVLTLVLIQLFQPDLFRLMRRKEQAFGTILAAFAEIPNSNLPAHLDPKKNRSRPVFANADVANVDLWRWVIDRSHAGSDAIWEPQSLENIPNYVINQIAEKNADSANERSKAQHVRFPLVAQIIEHRAAQRHVFDVLKLLKALANSMQKSDVAPFAYQFEVRDYFSLLVKLEKVEPTKVKDATFNILNPQALAEDLLSSDLAQQANIASIHELRVGQKIDDVSFTPVLNALSAAKEKGELNAVYLLNGLQYLAPYLAPADAENAWNLVQDVVDISKPVDPKLRALWHDVRAALGQDSRFEGKYALSKRVKGDADEAPPGFVKIEGGKFQIGSYTDKDNPIDYVSLKTFYISRYLVTVAQFDAFRQSNEFKEWSTSRPEEIRSETHDWAEQLANPYRPVINVNWFEVTAYAEWLQLRLEAGDSGVAVCEGYKLCLPDEKQWEVAARGGLVGKSYPWGNEVTDIDQRANVQKSIGHASTVGSYAGNPGNDQALYDMAGNVWEWQASEYDKRAKSLRGGSWIIVSGGVQCSYRDGSHPGSWSDLIGFRLVLSLADL